jgi:hypothetical protein
MERQKKHDGMWQSMRKIVGGSSPNFKTTSGGLIIQAYIITKKKAANSGGNLIMALNPLSPIIDHRSSTSLTAGPYSQARCLQDTTATFLR